MSISTHSLTRRLTFTPFYSTEEPSDFNSQPHKEADGFPRTSATPNVVISTHSLTRRLTDFYIEALTRKSISTHSLTRRLTVTSSTSTIATYHFNSQPHKEADGLMLIMILDWKIISTHSLTRRLTCNIICIWIIKSISTHSLTRRLTGAG